MDPRRIIENASIIVEPLFFGGLCVRSVMPMWFFEFDFFSDDNDKFLLVLDIFWYKMAVTGACALAQVVVVICHKLSAKTRHITQDMILPLMYAPLCMPFTDSAISLVACTQTSADTYHLRISDDRQCWSEWHWAHLCLSVHDAPREQPLREKLNSLQ